MWMLAYMDNQQMVLVVGGSIAIFTIFMGTIRKIIKTNACEQSRREIAAYIAEGSITADEGERLLNAGKKA